MSLRGLALVSISPFAATRRRCPPLPCFSVLRHHICAALPPQTRCIMTQLHGRVVFLALKPKKPQEGDPPGLGSTLSTVPSLCLSAWRWFCKEPFLHQHRPALPRHLLRRRSSARLRIRQSQVARSHLQAPLWHQVPDPAGTRGKHI